MSQFDTLGWWITNLPHVITEAITDQNLATKLTVAWQSVTCNPGGVKGSAQVCDAYDKWLESGRIPSELVEGLTAQQSYLLDVCAEITEAYAPKENTAQPSTHDGWRKLWLDQVGTVDTTTRAKLKLVKPVHEYDPRFVECVCTGKFTQSDVWLAMTRYAVQEAGAKKPQEQLKAVRATTATAPEWAYMAHVVRTIRTLLLGLKKWRIDDDSTSRDRCERDCLDSFINCQVSLRDLQLSSVDSVTRSTLEFARGLLREVLRDFSAVIVDCYPKPGPGSVEEGWSPLQKWGRLDSPGWYYSYLMGLRDENGDPSLLSDTEVRENLGVSRLCAVFKQLGKFRVITVEPNVKAMQQQLSREAMLLCVLRSPLTRHLRLDLQEAQQARAMIGSLGGLRYLGESTLDFSDASNRITNELVQFLFPSDVRDALMACRSYFYSVQDGREEHQRATYPMYAYAGMGNATCFIVETLVFWAITYAKLAQFRGLTLEIAIRSRLTKQVRVYGDDIIVPNELCKFSNLFELYKTLGWKLNEQKSYYEPSGLFRESCGYHAFLGQEVTPVRISGYKVSDPADRIALVEKVAQLLKAGYLEMAQAIFNESDLANTHVASSQLYDGNGEPAYYVGDTLTVFDWPERNPHSTKWSESRCCSLVSVNVPVPQKDSTAFAFRELLNASLVGYHYSTYRSRPSRPGGDRPVEAWRELGVKPYVTFPWYVAPFPRRVTYVEKWRPATSWGLDASV